MLIIAILATASTILIIQLKHLWEAIILVITLLNILLIITLPLLDTTFLISQNIILDSLSILMLSLSIWITSLIIIARQKLKIKKINHTIFLLLIILLLVILILCFSARNILFFYTWFESSLIPTFILIILWGIQPERKKARFYIILYTITASLPLLLIILKILIINYHINISIIKFYLLPNKINQYIRWLILMGPFIIKLPVFSLHLWLPKAHVEAPLAGSMILAGILLKLGGYGLIRINILINKPIFLIRYIIISIAAVGAIITNTICIRQIDLKALIAYSSVGHIRLLVISTLSNSKLGQYRRLIIILTHGLTSSCLFVLTNSIYEKTNSRNIILAKRSTTTPSISLIWILAISTNIALPPRLNILGEIITIISSFFIIKTIIIAIIYIRLSSAIYSTYLYSTINHGNQLKISHPVNQENSINIIISVSHLWPLLIFISIPIKLILWC